MSTTAVVLVIENRKKVREALPQRLDGPYRVLEAASLEEVRSAPVEDAPCPDLILSDLRGAGRQVLTLSRRLRADPILEATPVLLLVPPEETSGETDSPGGAEPLLPESVGPQDLRRLVGHHLATAGSASDLPMGGDAPLSETVEAVVEARLGDPSFAVAELAEAVDLSRRQLTRRMKEAMETTPAAFIRTRRLERAEELLIDGPETVKEVARAVGFASPSAFAKSFREEMGCPPSTYAER